MLYIILVMRFLIFIISLLLSTGIFAQGEPTGGNLSVNCTVGLSLGSFLLSRGLASAEDTGSSRLGITASWRAKIVKPN